MSIRLEIPKDPTIMAATAKWLIEQARAIAPSDTPEDAPAAEVFDGNAPSSEETLAAHTEKVIAHVAEKNDLPVPTPPTPPMTTAQIMEEQARLEVLVTPALEVVFNDSVPSSPTTEVVDVDARGMPWDARIHASSRAKLAKTNNWKNKRGVDATLLAKVEAELMVVKPHAIMSEPLVDTTYVPPTNLVVPPPPTTDAVVPPPPPPADTGEITFITLSELIGALTKAKKIGPTTLTDLLKPYGAVGFGDLSQDSFKPMYPAIAAAMQGLLNA